MAGELIGNGSLGYIDAPRESIEGSESLYHRKTSSRVVSHTSHM